MERKSRIAVGDLVTVQGVAQALGLSYWQVYRIIRKNRVPVVRVGNTLLLRVSDVEVYR
jgi:excisionase family DNA binding protein